MSGPDTRRPKKNVESDVRAPTSENYVSIEMTAWIWSDAVAIRLS